MENVGVAPYFLDKPNPAMMCWARRKLGVHSTNCFMIGHPMDTDIVGGLESDMTSCLALSGVTTSDMVDRFPYISLTVLLISILLLSSLDVSAWVSDYEDIFYFNAYQCLTIQFLNFLFKVVLMLLFFNIPIIQTNMDSKDKIQGIIEDFMNNASSEALLEFKTLMERREKQRSMLGKINIGGIAGDIASDIKERMGLTTENISQFTKDIVRNMIMQYDPNISEDQIQELINQWVPGSENTMQRLPHDAMITMIAQFVAYGRGELTKEEIKEFPDGWMEKYWAVFPVDLQKFLISYIKGHVGKGEFWNAVEEFLQHSSEG